LEIEATNDDKLDKLAIEPEIVAEKTINNCPKKRLTVSELMAEKRHIFAIQEGNRAKFLESQARFAESIAKFNSSKKTLFNDLRKSLFCFFESLFS
jgi:uncharacterized protein (UPF0216 family)